METKKLNSIDQYRYWPQLYSSPTCIKIFHLPSQKREKIAKLPFNSFFFFFFFLKGAVPLMGEHENGKPKKYI